MACDPSLERKFKGEFKFDNHLSLDMKQRELKTNTIDENWRELTRIVMNMPKFLQFCMILYKQIQTLFKKLSKLLPIILKCSFVRVHLIVFPLMKEMSLSLHTAEDSETYIFGVLGPFVSNRSGPRFVISNSIIKRQI